jgi:hypothetical protein
MDHLLITAIIRCYSKLNPANRCISGSRKAYTNRVGINKHLKFTVMTSHILTGGEAPLFSKRTVAELSEIEMTSIDGGSSAVCGTIATAFSVGATVVMLGIGAAGAGYAFGYYVGSWIGGIINGENGQTVE